MAKVGVIHYNFPDFSLHQFLQFMVDTGYEYTELMLSDVWHEQDTTDEPEHKAETLRQKMDSMGLKVSALYAANDFLVVGEEAKAAQASRVERVAKLAKLLGTDILRCDGGHAKEEIEESQWVPLIVDGFKRCCEFAPKLDVRFALDNHGIVTNDADRQIAIFKAVGSDRLGANVDTMNYRWAGHSVETIRGFCDRIAPYVFHTHLKDGTGSMEQYKGAALGEGEIDLEHAVAALKRAGYDGAWIAEYEGPEAAGGVGYAKCYQWLKSHV